MTTTAVPLDEFARRITQQQAELEALRQEYQARQTQLADLGRRKQELQEQLAQVENQIQTVTQGKVPRPASVRPKVFPAKKPVRSSPAQPTPSGSLAPLLETLVREAKHPVTVKQLTEELLRRKFPTTSKNLAGVVQTRVGELLKKGIFRRSEDRSGVVPATAVTNGSRAISSPGERKSVKPHTQTKAASVSAAKPSRKQPPLRVVLTELLRKSKRPLSGSELAEQAQKAGYRSDSVDFANVVWVMLKKMENVEHLRDQGYRLKKS